MALTMDNTASPWIIRPHQPRSMTFMVVANYKRVTSCHQSPSWWLKINPVDKEYFARFLASKKSDIVCWWPHHPWGAFDSPRICTSIMQVYTPLPNNNYTHMQSCIQPGVPLLESGVLVKISETGQAQLTDGFHGTFYFMGKGRPCCLLIGQYTHHIIILPSSFYGENCNGIYCACAI